MQTNVILPCAPALARRSLACRSLACRTSAAAVGLCAALLGCSDDSINMGEGVPVPVEPPTLPVGSRCVDSPILEGDVVVRNQEELDALEGCQVIEGHLSVAPFEGAELHALYALTEVTGALGIGIEPDPYNPTVVPDSAAQQVLSEGGWLASLEGLEALESAGSLSLEGLASEDVKPLGNLRELTDESLSIGFATNLKNFYGLQNLTGLRSLYINAALQLESFDGLTLPEYMGSLHLTDVDLRQLQPLGVNSIETLHIEDTQLRDFSRFAGLSYAGSIQIVANQRLTSLAGLEDLQQVNYLHLNYNRRLVEVPDFEYMVGLNVLRITGSPLLTRLPAFQTMQLRFNSTPSTENFILSRPDEIEIVELGITTFNMPAGWLSAAYVRIAVNANLTHIDFSGQTYIDHLTIHDNPQLESVSTGVLDKVNVLDVVDNPKLPMTEFASVRRLDTAASGNADAP